MVIDEMRVEGLTYVVFGMGNGFCICVATEVLEVEGVVYGELGPYKDICT